jgi:AcrR family transcriptional regulator
MVLRVSLEKKEEKGRVRSALLRAALRLAAEHGFASLGLREVARESGIAPTSFYRHFADMPELGDALVKEIGELLRREVGSRLQAAAPTEAVTVAIDALLEIAAQDPDLVRFLIAERCGAFARFRTLLRSELAWLAVALHAAARGDKPAPGAPPPFAAEAAVAVLLEGCCRILDDPQSSLRDGLAAAMRTLLDHPDRAGRDV